MSIGLRQLHCGRPVNVERVLYESKGVEKTSSLLLNRDSSILRNLGGTLSERVK